MPSASEHTIVIEDGVVSRRVRRPIDLARMVGALAGVVAIVVIATVLIQTFSGIDKDVADSAAKLPGFIAVALGLVSGLGQFVLPVAVAINLVARKLASLLAEAFIAFAAAAALTVLANDAASLYGSRDLWYAIAGTTDRGVVPLQPLLAGVFAFLTVSRLRGRVSSLAAFFIVSALTADVLGGGFTAASLGITTLSGWAVGLAFRYALGTPTTRPRGAAVASALAAGGYPVTVLRATHTTDRGRRYAATTTEGEQLHVIVFDRDLEGAGVIPRWWRSLRLRDNDALGGWTMREAVERSSLMAYASASAGAPVPNLKLVRAIGEDACVLAYDWVDGLSLETLIESEQQVSDAALTSAWVGLQKLHTADIAHRGISADHMIATPNDDIMLVHITSGTVAMSDLQARIDIADMLITLALVSSPQRAIATGTAIMGETAVMRALPALQPFALTRHNRKLLRAHKELLPSLRTLIAELAPGEPVESISIERLSPRKVLSIVGLLIAAYILIGQFAQVDVVSLIAEANYAWVLVAAIATLLTYIGSAMALDGFVVEKLNHWRTFLAQWAASFATLVSPPTLGTVAVNGRYLVKSGLPSAAAGAAVGLSQVIAFFIHIGLLGVAAVIAGTDVEHSFSIPKQAMWALGGVVVLLIIVLPLPAVRKYLVKVARPRLEEVVPRLVTLTTRPMKLVTGIVGILLLNVAFCVALIASVRAFGGAGSVAAISLVYLAGSTLGQAAPTPGGIGAVETVMTAGLVAAGVDGGVALSAVLLYRLLTFWLPTIPGWFAFQYLGRKDNL